MLLSPFAIAPLAVTFLINAAAASNNGGFDQAANTDTSPTKDSTATKAQSPATKSASMSELLVDTRYDTLASTSPSECSGTACTVIIDGTIKSLGTDTPSTTLPLGSSLSYNQWGFTGSQSRWSENPQATAVTVMSVDGTLKTVSLVELETVISGSTVTLTTSKADLTVSRSTSSGSGVSRSSETANGGSSLALGHGITFGWKRAGALMSIVALTVGIHCI